MITAYKFKKFEIQAFHSFIWDLIDLYDIGQIQFYPERARHLFNDHQLRHIGRTFDQNNQGDFSYIWSKQLKNIKTVTFIQFHKSDIPKVKMTIDLKNKMLVLEDAEGITAENIKNSFGKFFRVEEISGKNFVDKWWKYTNPIWWIWFVLGLVFRDALWGFLKFVWQHKWTKWLVANMALPIIIVVIGGCIVAFITYKSGWIGSSLSV